MFPRINYIVACYLGKRRSAGLPGEVFLERHLTYLEENNIPVDRVSVVLSADDQEQVARANLSMRKNKKYLGFGESWASEK